MKVFNLKRGKGKTTRMIYASELHNAPILCTTESHKHNIICQARNFDVEIPEPITVQEFVNTKRGTGIDKILVDELLLIIQNLLSCAIGRKIDVIAATLSTDESFNKNEV